MLTQETYGDVPIGHVVTHNFIGQKLRKFDRDLYATKWWDYRFMSPFDATLEYIDAFGEASRVIYSREIDYERAKHIRVVSRREIIEGVLDGDIRARQSFSAFWRGRQVADAIGMPYPVYIHEAMTQRMRAWQRSYLPKPGHIYSERDVERVAQRWAEINAERIMYAEHWAYLPQNYDDAEIQNAYYAALCARVDASALPTEILRDMIAQDRIAIEYIERYRPDLARMI